MQNDVAEKYILRECKIFILKNVTTTKPLVCKEAYTLLSMIRKGIQEEGDKGRESKERQRKKEREGM